MIAIFLDDAVRQNPRMNAHSASVAEKEFLIPSEMSVLLYLRQKRNRMKKFLFIGLIFSFAILSCGQNKAPSIDKSIAISVLRFESPTEEKRFKCLHEWFAKQGRGAGWHYAPLSIGSNFIGEEWMKGSSPGPRIINNDFMEHQGNKWYQLDTLIYTSPHAFGIWVRAGNNPLDKSWGIYFSYSDNGKSILASDFSIIFSRFEDSSIVQEIKLGDRYLYKAGATDVELAPPGGKDAELARYFASPDSLKTTFVERQKTLFAEIEKIIREHRADKIIYGPYLGKGIPPVKKHVAMTAQDEEDALEEARKESGANISAVEDNFRLFYQLLSDLIDFKLCWKLGENSKRVE